jgi:endonuclease G
MHRASTLGGNSGSAVIDARTGAVVALHFGGTYLDANFTVPTSELARDRHVITAGLKFQNPVAGDEQVTRQWWSSFETVAPAAPTPPTPDQPATDTKQPALSREATWTLPLTITIRLGDPVIQPVAATAATTPQTERMAKPTHDPNYA